MIAETIGLTTTVYIGNIYEKKNQGGTITQKKYYYAGSLRVAVSTKVGAGSWEVNFLLSDHLDSTSIKSHWITLRRTAPHPWSWRNMWPVFWVGVQLTKALPCYTGKKQMQWTEIYLIYAKINLMKQPTNPSTNHSIQLVKELRIKLEEALQEEVRVILFGSYARGEAVQDSDLDVFVVLNQLDKQTLDTVLDISWQIGYESGKVISIIPAIQGEMERLSASPFFQAIQREGISV
jgi:hypothetical protein